jgi:hypothetical protein
MTDTPPPPVETVRALYAAFARRDRDGILALLHPQIVWVQNAGFPNGGPHTGAVRVVDEVLARFRKEWSDWRADVRELLEAGRAIVALGAYRGTHAATGRSMTAAFAHVYWVEAGRLTRFEQYTDTRMVAEALPTAAPARPPVVPPPLRPAPSPRNEHGDPADTLYAGGTPLFDETGGAAPPGGRKRR